MKIKHVILSSILLFGTISKAQESDSLGVIGDNLDLYAVMDAFKDAESIEAFENTINDPEKKINNLDLDENGDVDYISVIDNTEKDAHAIVLRIEVSETESQDIAVFELEKTGDEVVNIQLVGDEDIYGENYIVEPLEEKSSGNEPPVIIVVNVWHWPSVRHVYGPKYRPYRSPYGWNHHPKLWKPWKPYGWRTYNGYHQHHGNRYRRVNSHRNNNAHGIYNKHRRTWGNIGNHPGHHKNGYKGNGNHNGNKGHNNNGHKGNKGGHKTNNGHNNNNNGGHKSNKGGHKGNKGGKKH